MNADDYSVTLRIRHPNIDPRELTDRLGIYPQHSWKAGDPRRSAAGDPIDGTYRETYWVGLVPTMPPLPHGSSFQPPQTMIFFKLLKMRRDAAFWEQLVNDGGSVECVIEIHSGGDFQLDLASSLLSLLAQLRITLSVESHRAVRRAAA
jgi:hypothetical protein